MTIKALQHNIDVLGTSISTLDALQEYIKKHPECEQELREKVREFTAHGVNATLGDVILTLSGLRKNLCDIRDKAEVSFP